MQIYYLFSRILQPLGLMAYDSTAAASDNILQLFFIFPSFLEMWSLAVNMLQFLEHRDSWGITHVRQQRSQVMQIQAKLIAQVGRPMAHMGLACTREGLRGRSITPSPPDLGKKQPNFISMSCGPHGLDMWAHIVTSLAISYLNLFIILVVLV